MNPSRRTSRPAPAELDPTVIHDAIVGGSRAALARLYDHYEGKVRHCVARAVLRTGHRGDIEEVLQETWCRFLDKDRRLLRYYDPTRSGFSFYIGWVAYQQASYVIERQRRRSLGQPWGDGDELADGQAARFTAWLLQSDLLRKLLDRIEPELDERDRQLIRGHYLQGITMRELAKGLDIPENTLHQRNKRLKRKLMQIVEDLLRPDHDPTDSTMMASVLVALLVLLGLNGDDPESGGSSPATMWVA